MTGEKKALYGQRYRQRRGGKEKVSPTTTRKDRELHRDGESSTGSHGSRRGVSTLARKE